MTQILISLYTIYFCDCLNTLSAWLPGADIDYVDSDLNTKVSGNPLVIEHWPKIAIELKASQMDPVEFLRNYAEIHSINLGKLMLPLRYTLSGQKSGPDLLPAISLLGGSLAADRMAGFCGKFIKPNEE